MMPRQLEPEHAAFLRQRFAQWASEQHEAFSLRVRLLVVGGLEVVAPPNLKEPDAAELVASGQVFNGAVQLDLQEENACHANAARLYRDAPSKDQVAIGTGWALHDGLWRQHSWFLRGGTIVETTVTQETYFGLLLRGDRAEFFVFQNL